LVETFGTPEERSAEARSRDLLGSWRHGDERCSDSQFREAISSRRVPPPLSGLRSPLFFETRRGRHPMARCAWAVRQALWSPRSRRVTPGRTRGARREELLKEARQITIERAWARRSDE
jgi:hypothetical protein